MKRLVILTHIVSPLLKHQHLNHDIILDFYLFSYFAFFYIYVWGVRDRPLL